MAIVQGDNRNNYFGNGSAPVGSVTSTALSPTGSNRITALGGNDTIEGTAANDVILPGVGNDRVDGGGGVDTVSYADFAIGISINLTQTTAQGVISGSTQQIVNVENVIGSNLSDEIRGNGGGNLLAGGAEDDQLFGLDGNDELRPGANTNFDLLDGGAGNDLVSFIDVTTAVAVNLSLTGTQMVGSSGSVQIQNVENLYGGHGNDVLRGTATRNVMAGLAGDDRMFLGAGWDVGYGGADDDYIDGGFGQDRLFGQAGEDGLVGNAGNDVLTGGYGDDTLAGGAGADRFHWAATDLGPRGGAIAAGLIDVITDFGAGDQIVALAGVTAAITGSGNAASDNLPSVRDGIALANNPNVLDWIVTFTGQVGGQDVTTKLWVLDVGPGGLRQLGNIIEIA